MPDRRPVKTDTDCIFRLYINITISELSVYDDNLKRSCVTQKKKMKKKMYGLF